jgi:hypothetical protein
MRLPHRGKGSAWFDRCREAGSGYLREGSYDGAIFGGSVGEFDIAADPGSTQRTAGDVGSGDLGDARRRYRNAEACTYEPENRKPLWCLLDDARTKALFFAETDCLLIGKCTGGGSEEDEGLVAEVCYGDGFALYEGMIVGQNGDEWLGEKRLDGESFGWIAIAKYACVEGAFCKGLNQV